MNIVILAGGTGSIALQSALFHSIEHFAGKEDVDVKIIVNAYDNGLSTGAVRKVMNGKILGPSDVRKNQTTRLKLEHPKSPWHAFLDIRFSKPASEAEEYCSQQVTLLERALGDYTQGVANLGIVDRAIKAYFHTPLAAKIDYDDFSLANIVYAGLAKMNKNSLRAAAAEMSKLLGIKDNVLLNDDTSLFLGAITESGIRVTDEGDIVSWGRMDDPFVDIFFTDSTGCESKPVWCNEAREAIVDADLIILSTGTQWSSLIPTYASSGFSSAIEQSDAKIIMLMNRIPDKDSPGQSASDIIDILVPKYFPESRLHVICDSTADPIMQSSNIDFNINSTVAGIYSFDLSDKKMIDSALASNKHSPYALAKAIANVYWGIEGAEQIKNTTYVFDYDDTLIGRGNTYSSASAFNVKGISVLNEKTKVAICTGNGIKAIKLARKEDILDAGFYEITFKNPILRVFADGGVNEYAYSTEYKVSDDGVSALAMKHLDSSKVLGRPEISLVMNRLREAGIPIAKIENRGDTVIAIKPVDPEYRPSIVKLLEMIFVDANAYNSSWKVEPTGRTTIEICKVGISKVTAMKRLLGEELAGPIVFVGDELDSGNDRCIRDLSRTTPGLTCLKVKSPAQTAWLIHALLDNLRVTILK
jgi:2-phospho-L-lactate transferase/gluconeogenesis factor (CofD/UPF0052 family)/hydroxymethylpyrimidine pyrophosphatase-like HAD family hydrolase